MFSFDTPKSVVNRYTSIELESGFNPQAVNMLFVRTKVVSPLGNGLVEIGTLNDDKHLALYAKGVNSTGEYIGKLGLRRSGGDAKHQEYTPLVTFQSPGFSEDNIYGYTVKGKIVSDTTNSMKYYFKNLEFIGPNVKPLVINGDIEYREQELNIKLKFTQDNKYADLKSLISIPSMDASSLNVKVDVGLQSNFNSLLNGRVIADISNQVGSKSSNFVLIYGPDLESKKNRLELFSKVLDGDDNMKSEWFVLVGAIPAKLKYNLESSSSNNEVKFDIKGDYEKHSIGTDIDFIRTDISKDTYNLKGKAFLNNLWINLDSARQLNSKSGKFQLTNKLTTSTGILFELNGVIGPNINENEIDIKINGKLILGEKQEPYGIDLVAFGTSQKNKFTSKVAVGKQELISAEILVNKTNTLNGTIALKIVDLFDSYSDFVYLNNKLQASSLINVKNDKKLKFELDYSIAGTTHNLNTEFYYDYEKNNENKIKLSSKTKLEQSSVDSKNVITINDDKYLLNFDGSRSGKIEDGVIQGKLLFQLPSQRQFTSSFNRQVKTINSDSAAGSIKFDIYDRNGKSTRSIVVSGNLNQGNLKTKIFDINHSIVFTDYNKNVLEISTNAKHLPKDDGKIVTVGLSVRGNAIRNPISINFNEKYNENLLDIDLSAKYGNEIEAGASGRIELGDKTRPFKYNIETHLNSKENKNLAKKLEASGYFLQSENGIFQYQSSAKLVSGNKIFKYSENLETNVGGGKFDFTLDVPDVDPVKGILKYSYDENSGHKKFSGNIKLENGANVIQGNGGFEVVDNTNIDARGSLQTSYSNLKNVDLVFSSSKTYDNRYKSDAKLNADGNVYGWNSVIVISNNSPEIRFEGIYPGKTVTLISSFKRLEPEIYQLQIVAKNFGNFNLDSDFEISLANKETFYIRSNIHSELLNLNKFNIEVKTKPGSNGRGITFKATKDGSNIFDGFADITLKEDRGQTLLEGTGSIKIYSGNQKPVSFVLQRTNFELSRDGELGYQVEFQGVLGTQNIKSGFKITDRHLNVKINLCDDKPKCVDFEISSKVESSTVDSLQHEGRINVDLRKLGYYYVFNLRTSTNRKNIDFKHNTVFEVHTSDSYKYLYEFALNPTEAVITLTAPNRVMQLQGHSKVPREVFGKYDISVTFYVDKLRQPNKKSSIGFEGELNRSKTGVTSKSNFKVSYPKLKDFIISANTGLDYSKQSLFGDFEFDVFQKSENKLTVSSLLFVVDPSNKKEINVEGHVKVNSPGFKINSVLQTVVVVSFERQVLNGKLTYEIKNTDLLFEASLLLSEPQSELKIVAFKEDVLEITATSDRKKYSGTFSSSLKLLKSTPILFNVLVQNGKNGNFELSKGDKFRIKGQVQANKEGTIELTGNQKLLASGKILLNQAQFLQTEYDVKEEEIKNFLVSKNKSYIILTTNIVVKI